ncbi:MAG TPA: PadR family transcriptional regulator [Gemmatimonadetes bacterium]|jgi:DNA-binding PadR family transcriptional regulator|nr:PadR family transcriptional regulator [Gemmatimonadota bacterium]
MGKRSLGEFELLVLLAIVRLGDEDAYAVTIVDEIVERTGREVRRAAVYTTLQRLEAKGLVSTWLGVPRAERGGKARRNVRVEPVGMEAIREAQSALQSMWGDLPALGGASWAASVGPRSGRGGSYASRSGRIDART